ncbi:MAG: fibronectin type III domain-containing protein [bacterium]
MMSLRSSLVALTCLAITGGLLGPSAAAAAPAPRAGETEWAPAATVASRGARLTLASTDVDDDVAVAAVVRRLETGRDVIDVYAQDLGAEAVAWDLLASVPADDAGTLADVPDIAVAGESILMTWAVADTAPAFAAAAHASGPRGLPGASYVVKSWVPGTAPEIIAATGDRSGTPRVDGAADPATGRAHFLVTWTGNARGTEEVLSRDWSSGTWSQARVVWDANAADGRVGRPARPQVQLAQDGSAAIGFTVAAPADGALALTLSTRRQRVNGAEEDWGNSFRAWRESVTVASDEDWSMGLPATDPEHVSVAWHSATGGVRTMIWVQHTLAFGAVVRGLEVGLGASAIPANIEVVSSLLGDVVTWTQQTSASAVEPKSFTIESIVWRAADDEDWHWSRFRPVGTGTTLGFPSMSLGQDDAGRVTLALASTAAGGVGQVDVYQADWGAPSSLWTGAGPRRVSAPRRSASAWEAAVAANVAPVDERNLPSAMWMWTGVPGYRLAVARERLVDRRPSPPVNVQATAGDRSAPITWDAPLDPGSSPLTEYVVTSRPGLRSCATDGARMCTITLLTNGTPYEFTVEATNAVGTSAASAPSNTVTPSSNPVGPLPPDRITVRAKAGRVIVVRWPESASPSAVAYVLRIRKNSGAWQERDMGASRLYRHRQVMVGARYCYRVASVDASGLKGAWGPRQCVTARR